MYEDNALGRLTDERFVFLTSGYEDEKKSLEMCIRDSLHGACAPTAQAEPKRRLPDKIERFSPTRQLWKRESRLWMGKELVKGPLNPTITLFNLQSESN